MKRTNSPWNIGELQLRLPHMGQADARWIAREVSRRLAEVPAPHRSLNGLTVQVAATGTREQTAAEIANSIVRSCR